MKKPSASAAPTSTFLNKKKILKSFLNCVFEHEERPLACNKK